MKSQQEEQQQQQKYYTNNCTDILRWHAGILYCEWGFLSSIHRRHCPIFQIII
jgi:hypothetical protein